MIRVWRIVHQRNATTAFSGDGSRKRGGRWTGRGTRAVYVADSLALATLEVLVHGLTYSTLQNFVCIPAEIPFRLIGTLALDHLPPTWRDDPPPSALQEIGNQWFAEKRSAVLKIPSAVIPVEFNYVIDPHHPDFSKIKIGPAQPHAFDNRLFSEKPA